MRLTNSVRSASAWNSWWSVTQQTENTHRSWLMKFKIIFDLLHKAKRPHIWRLALCKIYFNQNLLLFTVGMFFSLMWLIGAHFLAWKTNPLHKVRLEQEVNDTWGVGSVCFRNVYEHFETWKHEKLLICRTGTERKKTTRNDHNFKNI